MIMAMMGKVVTASGQGLMTRRNFIEEGYARGLER